MSLNKKDSVLLEVVSDGSDNTSFFAAKLFRAYSRYAERKEWNIDVIKCYPTDIGVKEVVVFIIGKDVYRHLKFESGIHSVTRKSVGEVYENIVTFGVSVDVLPEAKEADIQIDTNDLSIYVYERGPGSQDGRIVDSAVRITHLPTGTLAECWNLVSQNEAKEKAMRVLRTKLFNVMNPGFIDQNKIIRDYNYLCDEIIDRRVDDLEFSLKTTLDGDLNSLIKLLTSQKENKNGRKVLL